MIAPCDGLKFHTSNEAIAAMSHASDDHNLPRGSCVIQCMSSHAFAIPMTSEQSPKESLTLLVQVECQTESIKNKNMCNVEMTIHKQEMAGWKQIFPLLWPLQIRQNAS